MKSGKYFSIKFDKIGWATLNSFGCDDAFLFVSNRNKIVCTLPRKRNKWYVKRLWYCNVNVVW